MRYFPRSEINFFRAVISRSYCSVYLDPTSIDSESSELIRRGGRHRRPGQWYSGPVTPASSSYQQPQQALSPLTVPELISSFAKVCYPLTGTTLTKPGVQCTSRRTDESEGRNRIIDVSDEGEWATLSSTSDTFQIRYNAMRLYVCDIER